MADESTRAPVRGASPGDAEWTIDRLDLEAYLARVGYRGNRDTTVQTLRSLHRAHAAAIPFENLDIQLGRTISLELDALQDKLLRRTRGGYCFEQNTLLAAALERFGFRVTRLAARVRNGVVALRPRSHMLLHVHADGADWIADVGFGGGGLLEPIRMSPGTTVQQGQWRFRLDREEPDQGRQQDRASQDRASQDRASQDRASQDGASQDGDAGHWVLRRHQPEGWFDLYAFTLEPQHLVDYEVYNHYTATHPSSPFVTRPVVQQSADDMRRMLVDREFTVVRADGTSERHELTAQQAIDTVRTVFGIELDPAEAARLGTVFAATEIHSS